MDEEEAGLVACLNRKGRVRQCTLRNTACVHIDTVIEEAKTQDVVKTMSYGAFMHRMNDVENGIFIAKLIRH